MLGESGSMGPSQFQMCPIRSSYARSLTTGGPRHSEAARETWTGDVLPAHDRRQVNAKAETSSICLRRNNGDESGKARKQPMLHAALVCWEG